MVEQYSDTGLPPGTVRIEDVLGQKIVLSPQPSADPNEPLNWSTWRKTLQMSILSLYGVMVFAILCSSPPTWNQMNAELGISFEDLNNAYATGQGAMAVGCIFFVPLASKLGRRPIYMLTSAMMIGSAVWFGKVQTSGDFYGASVLMGLAGTVNEALLQMTVADLFFVHQRGSMNGVFLFVTLMGSYLAPVAAGFITDSQGWRWFWWYCTIFMTVSTVLIILFLEESKYIAPEMAEQTTSSVAMVQSREETSSSIDQLVKTVDGKFVRTIEIDTKIPLKSYRQRHALFTTDRRRTAGNGYVQHLYQPFLILFQFPAVAFAALQWGWIISMLGVLAVVQALLYPLPPYNFSAAGVGLQNLPVAIGCVLGTMFGGPLNDRVMLLVAKRRKGIYEPESRLILFLIPGLAMTLGELLFGLTIAEGKPWIINAVGAAFLGFSFGGCGDMVLTYIQDSYQDILGDALVAVVFVRNALGLPLVFVVSPWLANMGAYNMFVILSVIGTVIVLTSVPLLIWGRTARVKLATKYSYYAVRQY